MILHPEITDDFVFRVRRVGLNLVAFFGTFLLIWVGYRSLVSSAPLVQESGSVQIEYRQHSTLLLEERIYKGSREETVTFTRHLYKKHDHSQQIYTEGGAVHFTAERFTTLRAVAIPAYVVDEWCSAADVSWWPSWSQREFSAEMKPLCFELNGMTPK